MAKLNKIIVDSVEYDVGEVQRVNDLPATVTTDSPEIIIYNNQQYIKTIGEDGVMTYKLIESIAGESGIDVFVEDTDTLVLQEGTTKGSEGISRDEAAAMINAAISNALKGRY